MCVSLDAQFKCNTQKEKRVIRRRQYPKMGFAEHPERACVPMGHYHYLTIEEQESLFLMKGQNQSIRAIPKCCCGHSPLSAGNCVETKEIIATIAPAQRSGANTTDARTAARSIS